MLIATLIFSTFLIYSVEGQCSGTDDRYIGDLFQWDDGTTMSWSNFDSNFPKDNLTVAESVVNGKWRTLKGEQALFFVCSYDPRKVTPGTPGSTITRYILANRPRSKLIFMS
ncbi:hypothetical protein GCK72_015926 [Caenorhabditis remanei]|uniref:C-type lectin domain-containing protein n=1 Tax=Caenorhabditis remanei TaxID=31234 RepID=A0A6A5GXT9_CAERE|nr:hypothetical protein GCK72_015926 [Caenorhabditis remanei]KAF1759459.1 hypothetical protein GCK72_015926 [Caenorhabditis remanei]